MVSKRSVIASFVVLAAVLAVVAGVSLRLPLPSFGSRATPTRELLVAARLPFRTTDARLAEDHEHRTVGVARGRKARITRNLHRGDGVERARADAVAELLMGDVDAAVARLSETMVAESKTSDLADAIARSRNATLLNDLAAALWTRGRTRSMPADYVMAFEAAERSWRIDRSPASAWNRALSLAALRLDALAHGKWTEYLAVESDPEWIEEARGRMRALSLGGTSSCANARQQLDEALAGRELSVVTRLVGDCSDRARVHGEDVLLARWANAALQRSDGDAARSLEFASAIGRALSDLSGERLLQGSVRTIASASESGRRALMRGHALYGEGRTAYGAQNMSEAVEKLAAAESILSDARSPFAARACMYGAMSHYHSGRPAVARRQLRRCAALTFDSAALRGDLEWSRGLIEAASGHASEALTAYRSALTSFQGANEADNAAALHTQLAILHMLIGDSREAWRHRERALVLNATRELSPRRVQILLLDVARAASADGCAIAAVFLQSAVLDLARTQAQPDFLVNALQYRARYLSDAGAADESQRQLAEAERTLARIGEPAIRERSAANVRMTRAYVTRKRDPAAAVRLIEATIDELRRVDSRLLLPELYVELARAHADRREFDAAIRAIDAAVDETAFLNEKVGVWNRRRAHLDSQRRVREAGLEIFAAQRAWNRAYQFAERFDRQLQKDALPVSDVDLPRNTAIVKYAVLENRLLFWVIDDRGATAFAVEASSRSLRAAIESIEDDCSGTAPERCRRTLAWLHRRLLAPARSILPARVVIVPDDFLAAVPFAALFDDTSKRHVVQDHTILISRCATCVDARAQFDEPVVDRGRAAVVVAVGNPSPIQRELPPLPHAENEARELARRYPGTRLLVGAEATRNAFLSACRGAGIIHYAGHGVANLDNPELSALLFAATERDDGQLRVEEIAEAELDAVRLVVLAACRSNVGRFSAQGAVSLADAFVRAGVKTVVATLWDTDDQASKRLLSDFHLRLQRGVPATEALRGAQISMLENEDDLRSMLTWAAYQVVE